MFLSNYREPALERIGMGYERLSARNPGLIWATANGFGPDGPARQNRMTDQFSQVRSGISGITGTPDDPPLIPGAVIADTGGAMALAVGILTALVARQRDGLGQKVQTSSYGAMIWMQQWEINHTSVTGWLPERDGAFHPVVSAMTGIYEASDGVAFCLGIREDETWREFCEFGGNPELADDPRWNYREGRDPHRDPNAMVNAKLVRPHVAAMMKSRPSDEWQEFFDIHPDGAMAQRVQNYQEVLEDEQALVNGYIVEKDIPHIGKKRVAGLPARLSRTPGTSKGMFSEFGEHTEEVMKELGFSEPEIAEVQTHKTPPYP